MIISIKGHFHVHVFRLHLRQLPSFYPCTVGTGSGRKTSSFSASSDSRIQYLFQSGRHALLRQWRGEGCRASRGQVRGKSGFGIAPAFKGGGNAVDMHRASAEGTGCGRLGRPRAHEKSRKTASDESIVITLHDLERKFPLALRGIQALGNSRQDVTGRRSAFTTM